MQKDIEMEQHINFKPTQSFDILQMSDTLLLLMMLLQKDNERQKLYSHKIIL